MAILILLSSLTIWGVLTLLGFSVNMGWGLVFFIGIPLLVIWSLSANRY